MGHRSVGDAPTGYREKPQTVPSDDTENQTVAANDEGEFHKHLVPVEPMDDRNLVWHKLNNYNAESPALSDGEEEPTPLAAPHAGRTSEAPVVQYNHSVQVFPR